MISKLILCYELKLDELQESITYLTQKLQAHEILCLRVDELSLVNLEDYSIYCFHLDLNTEIQVHAKVSSWLLENDYQILNPYLNEANIFDDKYLFNQFMLANEFKHPKTFVYEEYDKNCETNCVVKARHGTEKRDFAEYSKSAIEKISSYDEILVQEKIDIKNEIKVLNLNGDFYADQILSQELKGQVSLLDQAINEYTEVKERKKISIYSIDILEDQDSNFYFLELNLRPAAFYRFKEKI